MEIRDLEETTQLDFELLTTEQKRIFTAMFDCDKKKKSISWLLFMFLGCHYFYCDKVVLGTLILILQLCGVGFIWLLLDLVTGKPSRIVTKFNNELAKKCMYHVKKHFKDE